MDESLRELAEVARELADPIDFESIIRDTIKGYGNIMRFGAMLYTFDYDSIFQRYAEKLNKPELTEDEKKQAMLNAVLEQANG